MAAGIASRPSPRAWLRAWISVAEGFLRLAGPDRARVGFRAVLQVTQYVGDAGLVAGDVLPCRVEVVAVPVGDRDAGEAGEDPEVLHGVQGAGAEVEQRVLLGERAVDVLLLPGRPGPQRGLVEPGDPGGDDQRLDQPHDPGGHRRGPGEAGVDEPGGHLRARRRRTAAAGTAPRAGAGRPAGRRPGHAAAARSTPPSPGRRAGGAPRASSRTGTASRAGRAGW